MVGLAVPLGGSVIDMVFPAFPRRTVPAKAPGTAEMPKVSDAIFTGAQAFWRRQYRTIAVLAVVAAVVIAALLGFLTSSDKVSGDSPVTIALKSAISFAIGAFCSGLAGYVGMQVAVRSNIRVASAAGRGLGDALMVALRGGAVSGFLVIALSLLGVTVVYIVFGALSSVGSAITTPATIVGFGFGASFVALFAQLGGGIYTKAADVGADLVGKVEAGIPEDDPRNPAVIAALVGDNVGDCAARAADVFESTAAENVGAMILGTALYPVFGIKGILFPLIVHAINLIASIVGEFVVKTREDEDPMHALTKGFYVTSALALTGFAGAVYLMLNGPLVQPLWLLGCGVIGLVT